jgi:hypothetical protein
MGNCAYHFNSLAIIIGQGQQPTQRRVSFRLAMGMRPTQGDLALIAYSTDVLLRLPTRVIPSPLAVILSVTPSPGPPRLKKTPAAGHPLPQGGDGRMQRLDGVVLTRCDG